MGGSNNGADMIEPMRGSGERAFIACTVDLLEPSMRELTLWKARDAVINCVNSDRGSTFDPST